MSSLALDGRGRPEVVVEAAVGVSRGAERRLERVDANARLVDEEISLV